MKALTAYRFDGRDIRVLDRDGDPWFVAVDVCGALGLENTTRAIEGLDEDERDTLSNLQGIARDGRAQALAVISESGLYTLILRSRKPQAKTFSRWVTREVLPSIRRTGAYSTAKSEAHPAAESVETIVRRTVAACLEEGLVDVSRVKLIPVRDRIHVRCDRASETDCRRIMGRVRYWVNFFRRELFPNGLSPNAGLCVAQDDLWIVDKAIDDVWERSGLNGLPLFRRGMNAV